MFERKLSNTDLTLRYLRRTVTIFEVQSETITGTYIVGTTHQFQPDNKTFLDIVFKIPEDKLTEFVKHFLTTGEHLKLE